jgi:two-component system nitrate/nitrite sensor histidine kinase NarX
MMAGDNDLMQHKRMIDSMHNVLRVLNSNRSLNDILAHIIAQPGALLNCDAAAIYCLDQEQHFYVQASEGMDASLTQFHDSVSKSFAQQLSRSPEPNIIPDSELLLQLDWVQQNPELAAYVQKLARHYRAYVAVPIIVHQEIRGALMVYYQQPRLFSPDEVHLITAFRDQAALALENAWLHEQVRQVAIADERDRIARDLHDSVTQTLYGITLCTEASIRHIASGDINAAEVHLMRMQGLAQEALGEMRALIYQLHSPFLRGQNLIEALQARIEIIEVQSHLQIDLIAQAVQLPVQVAEGLYLIMQEALNNILRHSRAQRVIIRLDQSDDCLALEVQDDGIGFEPRTQPGGFGLAHMAERAAALHGTFALVSAPGHGTTVRVEVPL